MSQPSVDELIRQFTRRDPAAHPAAGEAILALGLEGVSILVRCLRGGDEGSRQRAAELVISYGAAALPGLTKLVETSGPGVRARIAWVLGQMEGPEPYALLGALAHDANTLVRRHAVEAAGRRYQRELPGDEPLAILLAGLKDADRGIRLRTPDFLTARLDVRVVPSLVEALSDPNSSVVVSAATALGAQGDPRAVAGLVKALYDRVPSVRRAAAAALGKIGGGEAIGPLASAAQSPDYLLSSQAAEALLQIGPLAASALAELLKHKDPQVRGRAVWALSGIGTRAVPFLCEALRSRESLVRRSAAEALRHIARREPGPELLEAVPLLRRLLPVWSRESPLALELYRATLATIEEATASMKELPLPSVAPQIAGPELPLPATPAAHGPTDLPRPAAEGAVEPPSPGPLRGAGWLQRFFGGGG